MPKRRDEFVEEPTKVRGADVARKLAALQGQTRKDLVPDKDRGPVSPLGHGTGTVKRNQKRERGGRRDEY